MQRKIFTMMMLMLILLVACSQPEATPTPPELATTPTALPSNEKPTIEPTATPVPVEPVPEVAAVSVKPTELAEEEVEATVVPVEPTLTPEPEELVTYSAQVISYNLGATTILQEQFPEDNRFRNMPVRLEGVIGVPESDQAHPVVLIMHGSHAICPEENQWPCSAEVEQKNYEGFTYLVEALAEAGYAALSINVNAEHTFGYGEAPSFTARTAQLIDLHLGELVAANMGESDKFGIDLQDRVDLSQMVWLGHSRGGDHAHQIVREQNLMNSASPVGYGPVAGLILVAPPRLALETQPTAELPFSVILSACDGDVLTLSGQGFYESARLSTPRDIFGTSIYVDGANHNHYNTTLPQGYIPERPDCTDETLLPAIAQQEFLTQYTLDFLSILNGQPGQAHAAKQRLGMGVDGEMPTTYNDYSVRYNFLPPSANRLTLIQPESDMELSENQLGGKVILNGVVGQFCPEGYYVPVNEPGSEPCKRVNFNQPGYPQQFVVSWESPGAEWRMNMPDSGTDLSGYAAVQIRATLDPLSELNAAGEPKSFTIELVDANGDGAQVVVPTIEFPVGVPQENLTFDGGFFDGHVHMSGIRVPFAEFPGVDLANVTEVALIFDQSETGSLFVADLEFIKPDIGE